MKLKIGSLVYSVKPGWTSPDAIGDHLGLCNYGTQELLLDAGRPADTQAATLLHEITHALVFERSVIFPAKEEPIADMVGNGLAAVLRDNPHLYRALRAAWDRGVPVVPAT